MTVENLFNILLEDAIFDLNGTIQYQDGLIKWEYNSINADLEIDESELEHLDKIYSDDLEIIKDSVNLNSFYISEPEIEDTYISFYIKK